MRAIPTGLKSRAYLQLQPQPMLIPFPIPPFYRQANWLILPMPDNLMNFIKPCIASDYPSGHSLQAFLHFSCLLEWLLHGLQMCFPFLISEVIWKKETCKVHLIIKSNINVTTKFASPLASFLELW